MNKIFILTFMLLSFAACKPTDPTPPPAVEAGINLTVKIDALFDGQKILWANQYINTSNDSIQFDKIKHKTFKNNRGSEIFAHPEAALFKYLLS